MSDEKKDGGAATGGGVLKIGAAEFFVRKLSVVRENALWDHLASEAKKSYGQGGFVEKGAGLLEWMASTGRGNMMEAALRKLVEMEAKDEPPSLAAIEKYRRSPDGVALELWHRTRDDHKDMTREKYRAVVNEVNALDLYLQIGDLLEKKPSATPQGSPNSSD